MTQIQIELFFFVCDGKHELRPAFARCAALHKKPQNRANVPRSVCRLLARSQAFLRPATSAFAGPLFTLFPTH